MTDILLLADRVPEPPPITGKTDREKAEAHHYVVEPGGDMMPGVTTLAGLVDRGDGLRRGMARQTAELITKGPKWRTDFNSDGAYLGWLSGEVQHRWDARGDFGDRVHGNIRNWILGMPSAELPDEHGHMDAAAKFISDEVLEHLGCEFTVGSRTHKYGGRGDWLGRLRSYPGVSLVDWKTAPLKNRQYTVLKEALQLVGLATAEGTIAYDAQGMVTGLEPLPSIDHLLDVYLVGDGTYRVFETPMADGFVDLFRTCGDVWHGRKAAEKYLKKVGLVH